MMLVSFEISKEAGLQHLVMCHLVLNIPGFDFHHLDIDDEFFEPLEKRMNRFQWFQLHLSERLVHFT